MIFSRVLSLLIDLIRPLNFTPNDLYATSDTNFNISKICYVRSGFKNLYAVEQFSSLLSRQFSLMQSN